MTDDLTAALDIARRETQHAASVADTTGNALALTGTAQADQVKTSMASSLSEVARAHKGALEAQAKAREAVEAKKRELDAMISALNADLAPLQEKMKILQEGIWTVNLYLGRDETVVQLAAGEPAPRDETLHVRQQVLAMDEESLLYVESGGMDVADLAAFDEWVVASPQNLDRLIPEQRGVVAIVPRRKTKETGDPWSDAARAVANSETWWLIRNGQNVYRMLTDLNVGENLVPKRDEFTAMFLDRWTRQPIEPGSKAWLDAEKAAGQRERHFMRIALVLQGLVDRTVILHPLPEGGLNLLSQDSYDKGLVRLVTDDELILTDGRPSYRDWHASLMARLEVGTRVIVATNSTAFRGETYDRNPWLNRRLTPEKASYPDPTEIHTITRTARGPYGADAFSFPYTRHDRTDRWDDETGDFALPKTKGSCLIMPDDGFVLPLDYASIEELEYYIGSRTNRSQYEDMIPTLRAALIAKRAEAEAEEPFRAYLAAQLGTPDARVTIDALVTWWKNGNKHHRALVGEGPSEVKASTAILAFARRLESMTLTDQGVLDMIRTAHPNALLIARKSDLSYVVLDEQPRKYSPVDMRNTFTARTEYTKSGKQRSVTQWWLPVAAQVSRWLPIEQDARWATWSRTTTAQRVLTDDEIDMCIERLTGTVKNTKGRIPLLIMYGEQHPWSASQSREFRVWSWDGTPFTPPQDVITGDYPDGGLREYTARWAREGDTLRLSELRSGSHKESWSTGHWDVPFNGDDSQVKAPWGDKGDSVVWTDRYELARSRDCGIARLTALAHRSNLENVVQRTFNAVSAAWRQAQEDVAKAEFLADYKDDILWPDHRKNLEFEELHWHWNQDATIRRAISHTVEQGIDPSGVTVRDLITRTGGNLDMVCAETSYGKTRQTCSDEVRDVLLNLTIQPIGTEITQ